MTPAKSPNQQAQICHFRDNELAWSQLPHNVPAKKKRASELAHW
jgi:hypothetical protein